MEIIYQGKTKDLLQDGDRYFFKFKDDMTGTADGEFDTGGNQVAGSMAGAGQECLKVSEFFFQKMAEAGLDTAFVGADLSQNLMEIKKAQVFGQGLEVITRFVAVGSFVRRYGAYIEEGTPLPAYTEMTLKDDQREDPLVTRAGLAVLGVMTPAEYDLIVEKNRQAAEIVKSILAERGLELYDIKFEWGKDEEGNILLIDEVSGGNMRVYKNGSYVKPLELSQAMGL